MFGVVVYVKILLEVTGTKVVSMFETGALTRLTGTTIGIQKP